jgi:hypothetical protein
LIGEDDRVALPPMSPGSLVVLCASVGALLCGAPAAQAACTSSTPSSASFTDPAGDAEGAAPDLTELQFSVDAACGFSFAPGVASFTEDDATATLIDRDGNPATGDPDLFGSDLIAVTLSIESQSLTLLGWWDGDVYRLDESPPIEGGPAPGGFSVAVDRLGIAPGTTAAFRVLALGPLDEDLDVAPNSGDPITLTVNYQGAADVPAFPPIEPSPDPETPSPLPQLPIAPPPATMAGCTVPKVKGRTPAAARSRLTASGCAPAVNVTRRYSRTVRKGRVIGTTPRTGARTTKKVKLIVSKGKRPKRAKAAVLTRAEAILSAL